MYRSSEQRHTGWTLTQRTRVIFCSWPSHLLPFSNHWRGKTARIVLSTVFPVTGACTHHPQATARRCSLSTHPQRPLLLSRLTALGRKNRILLKSGPSPGACMRTDVSKPWLLPSPDPPRPPIVPCGTLKMEAGKHTSEQESKQML